MTSCKLKHEWQGGKCINCVRVQCNQQVLAGHRCKNPAVRPDGWAPYVWNAMDKGKCLQHQPKGV